MKILILGATGAFGTAVEKVCCNKNIPFVSLSHENFEVTNKENIEEVIDEQDPDVIINSVAIIGINPCEEEPEKTFDVNSLFVLNLAKICQKKEIILVQPSSHAVFDGLKEGYYTEEDIPNPLNVYSVSKYVAEAFAKTCEKHYIIRFPTLFGPRRNKSSGFVDKVLGWIKEGRDLKMADDKIDSPTYTLDAAESLISLIQNKKPFGVYHVANSGSISYYGFVSELINQIKADVKLIRAKDSDFPALGYKPLKTALSSVKLEPLRHWQIALKEYVEKELK